MSKGGQNSEALNAQLVNLDAIRKNANKVLTKINAQHEKARSKGTQLSEKQVEKLRGLYEQAYTLSQDERQVAIAAAELVSDLINTGKRKSEGGAARGKKRRNTAVQQHPITGGAMVAANNEGQWILGRVQEFDFSSQTYNIEDADKSELQADMNGMPIANIFRVPMHQVLPLMDPSCGIYFPKEERVLALYPETTTFYGANIVTSAKRRKTGDYMVLFDEETDKKAIDYMYVLQYPQ